jgi:hypothetical protein
MIFKIMNVNETCSWYYSAFAYCIAKPELLKKIKTSQEPKIWL